MSIRKIFTIILLQLAATAGYAQVTDSTTIKYNDSLLNLTLNKKTMQLVQLDSANRADSLKQADLESQVRALKTTDNLKKEKLLSELDGLKNAATARQLEQKRQVDSLKRFVTGYPVAPFDDTLFYIYTRVGPFTPQARANAISDKIKKLGKDPFYKNDSVTIYPSEQSVDMLYKDVIILSITDKDALWMDTTQQGLAAKYKANVQASVLKYKKDTSLKTILIEIGLALLVILLAIAVIYFINKLFGWTRKKIYSAKGKYIKGIKIRNYELFTVGSEIKALVFVNNIVKWAIILVSISLMLPLLFSIFPWTKNISDTLLDYILSPFKKIFLSVWHYLPRLVTVLVILFIFKYVFRALRYVKEEIENGDLKLPGFYTDWAAPTYQIARILVFAFMVIVVFPYLPGSDSQVFKGVSVFLGVLFTFGSSGSLSNVVAGLVLTYMRAYKIGDRVQIGDMTGDIIEKNLLVTRLRTIKNEDITIPNSTVMNSHTLNFSSSAMNMGLIIHTTVTIGYDAPWRTVHKLLTDAAAATDLLQKDPKPFVLQTSLDDFYVSYQINAYTNEPNKQALIYSNLHQNIQDEFDKAGVEIMSPHYTALRDGNQVTIPADYLPADYIAPKFGVEGKEGVRSKE